MENTVEGMEGNGTGDRKGKGGEGMGGGGGGGWAGEVVSFSPAPVAENKALQVPMKDRCCFTCLSL